MASQQCSEQIKLYLQSPIMAKVVQAKIKNSFPRLNIVVAQEVAKENPKLTNTITITGLYNACVEPLTEFLVPFAMDNNAVLCVMFDKDPAGNTETRHDFSVN